MPADNAAQSGYHVILLFSQFSKLSKVVTEFLRNKGRDFHIQEQNICPAECGGQEVRELNTFSK